MDSSCQPGDLEWLREQFPEWEIEARWTVAGTGPDKPVPAGVVGWRDPLGVDSGGPRRRDHAGDRRPLIEPWPGTAERLRPQSRAVSLPRERWGQLRCTATVAVALSLLSAVTLDAVRAAVSRSVPAWVGRTTMRMVTAAPGAR